MKLPVKGRIYMVRRSCSGQVLKTGEQTWGVQLVEIVNPDWPPGSASPRLVGEMGFVHWRFKEAELEAAQEGLAAEEREEELALAVAGCGTGEQRINENK